MAGHVKPKGRSCSHRRYQLSCEDYDALVLHADGRCQICRRTGEETGHGYLVVDHDDKLGYTAVRGLLCNHCNSQLAYFNLPEDPMTAYLAGPWHSRPKSSKGAAS